jgi:hypothetical protein
VSCSKKDLSDAKKYLAASSSGCSALLCLSFAFAGGPARVAGQPILVDGRAILAQEQLDNRA